MAPQKNIKCKNMMYVQQLKYMKISLEEFPERLMRMGNMRYAYIVHDQELGDDGQPLEAHVHLMMAFENAHSIKSVAKQLGDGPERIQKWDERANNGFSYLLHATKGASNKPQYEPSEVKANFDYKSLIEREIPGQIAEAREKRSGTAKTLLDMLYAGAMTKREVEAAMSGSMYGRYRSQIEAVWAKRLQIMAAEWREKKIAEGAFVQVVWIYGPAGCGKTSLAKNHARKREQDYFVSGSSRDPFQGYAGQHTIILDELRPDTMEYFDLLRILDPFSIEHETMAPARYSDRALACDMIIITTPYDPLEFYKGIFGPNSLFTETDSFSQLWRRLSLIIKMDYQAIELMTRGSYGLQAVTGTRASNPYSQANRPTPKISSLDIYRDMVDIDSAAPMEAPPTEKEENPFMPSEYIKTDDKPIKFDGT